MTVPYWQLHRTQATRKKALGQLRKRLIRIGIHKVLLTRKDLTEPRLPLGTLSGDDGTELLQRNKANSAKLEWEVHTSIEKPGPKGPGIEYELVDD